MPGGRVATSDLCHGPSLRSETHRISVLRRTGRAGFRHGGHQAMDGGIPWDVGPWPMGPMESEPRTISESGAARISRM